VEKKFRPYIFYSFSGVGTLPPGFSFELRLKSQLVLKIKIGIKPKTNLSQLCPRMQKEMEIPAALAAMI
jgi:hypothetical protein